MADLKTKIGFIISAALFLLESGLQVSGITNFGLALLLWGVSLTLFCWAGWHWYKDKYGVTPLNMSGLHASSLWVLILLLGISLVDGVSSINRLAHKLAITKASAQQVAIHASDLSWQDANEIGSLIGRVDALERLQGKPMQVNTGIPLAPNSKGMSIIGVGKGASLGHITFTDDEVEGLSLIDNKGTVGDVEVNRTHVTR